MRIGYACITVGLPYDKGQSCTQKNATPERLRAVTEHNLGVLERQVAYNRRHGIQLFRISSDLIPFGGSPVNPLPWQAECAGLFARIGKAIQEAGLRVSMHPGQYTVLTAKESSITERSINDLCYHAQVLDALGTAADCKIVLHVGGAYGNKPDALRRFAACYADLGCCCTANATMNGATRRCGCGLISFALAASMTTTIDLLYPGFAQP